MSQAEIDRLPDPELFRDAVFLADHGVFTPSDLDAMPVPLLQLVQRLKKPRKRRAES